MRLGPNFFIWIAIAVVVVATIPVIWDHYWTVWIGWPIAICLAIYNKVRAIRRRRTDQLKNFD